MRVAGVQHDIVWEDRDANFARLAPMIAGAAAEGARLIVLTEMFSTGFSMAVDRVAELPDGTSEILLEVPRYNFNWQHEYILAEPRRLPRGTRLRAIACFDNSADNPSNPDPDQTVYFGLQTWEEMIIGYFEVIWDQEER